MLMKGGALGSLFIIEIYRLITCLITLVEFSPIVFFFVLYKKERSFVLYNFRI